MDKFEEALAILDSTDENAPLDTIKKRLLLAYNTSDRLLDALVLYARTLSDPLEKEKILLEGIKREEGYQEIKEDTILDDSFFSRQFLRALMELAMLYLSLDRLIRAKEVLKYIYHHKRQNIYKIKEKLYALNTYFDKREENDFDLSDTDPRAILLADAIYYYEISAYDKAYDTFKKLSKSEEGLKDIFIKRSENEKTAAFLKDYAFLINRSKGLIRFLEEAIDD